MRLAARTIAFAGLIGAIIGGWGCARRLQEVAGVANQPPVVSLRSTAVGATDGGPAEHLMTWTAADPDGRVDHYLVTTDIRALNHETEGWLATDERSRTLQARRVVRGAARLAGSVEPEFDFFAVRAVDERGAASKPAYRAYFAENVAPIVRITLPEPSSLLAPTVPSSFWLHWEGSDPDGPNGRPAQYKYKLFKKGAGTDLYAYLADPDSLRRRYGPTFAEWDSVIGDSSRVRLENLEPGNAYLFVITALDAQGAFDPVFDLNRNMLWMVVGQPGAASPRMRVFNSTFDFTYPTGGVRTDSAWVVHVQAPAGEPFTLKWLALTAQFGVRVIGYRWALDIADIEDETARRNANDLAHWSAWDPATTSATVGPFHGSQGRVSHRLYVEVEDGLGSRSLAIVEVAFILPAFDRDLLIVDDTRFGLDHAVIGHQDSLYPPAGAWPTAAELDTFLFAVGGVRWRMTPPGTVSPAGIFAGYRFDTLGTRNLFRLGGSIPLEFLSRYRQVVWIVDQWASFIPERYWCDAPGCRPPPPILIGMGAPGATNVLATWVQQGGRLWALGGGFGNAVMLSRNHGRNDQPGERVYSSLGPYAELVSGCFMYDFSHWRSQYGVRSVTQPQIAQAPFVTGQRHGADYGLLPYRLRFRQPGTDALPPFRDYASFYNQTREVGLEYLSKPNSILEDKNPSARHAGEVQALDTLMVATAPELPPEGSSPAVDRIVNPVMTYYHGAECGSVVFSGFDIWSWSRPDCVRLVDAVLTGLWGLPRSADASGPAASARK